MATWNLPPEVCSRIVRYAADTDLPSLCRTSKLFQEHAEPKLYHDILLRDPRIVSRICSSLTARDGKRAQYLRRFWITFDYRMYPRAPLPEQFWRLIHDVFLKADNLEYLYITEVEACRPWLADPSSVHFQLRDAAFHMHWDRHLAAFLETQKRLRTLAVTGLPWSIDQRGPTHQAHPVAPGSLSDLITFEGRAQIASELLSSPLRHVQTPIDEEDGDAFFTFITKARTCKTLCSLHAVIIPDYLACDALRILAESPLCETLRYIGVLALPLDETSRSDIHRLLLKFHHLEILQLDLSAWHPPPLVYHQRMIASEIRVYCPTIRLVFVWISHHMYVWRCENDQWVNIHAVERRIGQDTTWRNI